ncbi:MAG TPA: ABC transporter permease [Terriglobales bacterium]|nr:ABC transporter permease [Terriglobales bacterium]
MSRGVSLRRISAVARKEAIHVWRDPRSLAVAIAIPILMLLLFGYALTLDVDNVPLMVWDQSGTAQSRELISHFTASRYFDLRGYATSYREVQHAIDAGDVLIGLVVPRDFSQQIQSGRTAEIQVIADGSDANTAMLALGYADVAAQNYSRAVTVERVKRAGMNPPREPVDARPRMWFNPDMESRNYIIPGLIAVIMMVITALLTSLTVAREWERGTMEQLISTPVSGPELVTGKLLPYFVIGMLDVGIAVGMGQFLFRVPLRGSVLLLFGMAAVFLWGVLSLGILISIVTRTQVLASQLAMMITYVPSFLLSGFVYSVANMPEPIQVISYAVPARYFVALLRGIYLKGIGLEILGAQAALLGVFSVGMYVIAIAKFNKKLVQQ